MLTNYKSQLHKIKLELACIIVSASIVISGCGNSTSRNIKNNQKSYADTILEKEIMGDINMNAFKGTAVTDGSAFDYSQAFVNAKFLGGDMTNSDYTSVTTEAYTLPSPNLTPHNLDLHLEGDINFETPFLPLRDSSLPNAGFGPVANHNNCNACHPRDGRSNMPYVSDFHFDETIMMDKNGFRKLGEAGVFLRISIENEAIRSAPKTKANNWGSPIAVPNFSDQLFQVGGFGVRTEAKNYYGGQADVWIKYKTKTITYPDGNTVELSRPYLFADNAYDDPDDPDIFNPKSFSENSKSRLFKEDVKMGIRTGMPVFGLGLLDAIKEEDILALADPNDADGDGVSGRPNWVFDKEKYDYCTANNSCSEMPPISLGRYGWKANTPTVAHQGLGAFRGDMGVTNPLFKMESTCKTDLMKKYKKENANFSTYSDTGETDADLEFSQAIVFYTETLAVPQRRNVDDPVVKKGAALFSAIGCTDCHNPSFVTGEKSASFSVKHDRNPYSKTSEEDSRIKEIENQTIFPFTDMLLHDMGPDLADGRQDTDANGSEWKTRPLWGIGLTQKVNGAAGFLHDSRARTLEEAILWLGGEAEEKKVHFMKLKKENRDALIKFLESL